eukprot:6482060-Amphidinium_carterae.1
MVEKEVEDEVEDVVEGFPVQLSPILFRPQGIQMRIGWHQPPDTSPGAKPPYWCQYIMHSSIAGALGASTC